MSPSRVAGHLAPFEAVGWTAETFHRVAGRVLADHGEHGWSTPAQVRSPGGFVYWLTQRMSPDEPAAVNVDQDDQLVEGLVDVEACGHPDCYRGWLPEVDDQARPCPYCPPVVRSPSWVDPRDVVHPDQLDQPLPVDLDADGNPPF